MEDSVSNNGVGPPLAAALYHALAHASPFPTALADGPDHLLRYANPAFCKLAGVPEESLLAKPLAEVLPQCAECVSLLNAVNQIGIAKSHTEHGSAAGRPTTWFYCGWPLLAEDGHSLGTMLQVTEATELQSQSSAVNEALLLSAVRQHEMAETAGVQAGEMRHEIAQRKQSEELLQVSESRLRLALESARASTWEWHIGTNTLAWSNEAAPGLETLIRQEPFAAWRAGIHAEDRAALDALAEQAVNASPRVAAEFRVADAHGAIRWLLMRGCLNPVADGHAVTYTGILLDVTERKHAEEALLRSEKLAGVGRLAATLAHEINNPLDAAMNALYLAQTSAGVPATALEYIALADAELRRVAHMTRQSLGFYREATSPTTFAVDALLDSVIALMKNRIDAKSITLQRRGQSTLTMTGIFGELRQVLVNLIANSVEATGPGGTIQLRSALHHGDAHRHIRITVADNGSGIDALQRTRIFEPFFTTKGELGTGLGLWVTRQILENHGGRIQVRSRLDRPHNGTVFSFVLPV